MMPRYFLITCTMKRILLIFSFYFLEINVSISQSFIKYWDKAIGGNSADERGSVQYISSGNLIIAGQSHSPISGDKTKPVCGTISTELDFWFVKTDTTANIIWDMDLGGNREDQFGNTKILPDGKIILISTSRSDSSCDKLEPFRDSVCCLGDYWIACADTDGTMLWNKTYGGIGTEDDGYTRVTRLNNGNLIICGRSFSPVGGDKTVPNHGVGDDDIWVLGLDTLGNKLWDKTFGGIGTEASFFILANNDNSFLIAGLTLSPQGGDVSDTSRGADDWWIIKIDSAGNKIWDKRFGGNSIDQCYHIAHTKDNGYIMCGITGSAQGLDVSDSPHGFGFDYWVIKIDSMGNKIWDKRYGGDNYNYGMWIEPDMDNGYLVAGYTNSNVSFEISEPSYGSHDYWILKIDSVGNKVWDKRYGGPGLDWLYNFVILPDSSIVLCGAGFTGVSPVKTDSGDGGRDYWLVRFKYVPENTSIVENSNENNLVSLYPNPVHNILNIKSNGNFKLTEIMLYDVQSRKVMEERITSSFCTLSVKGLKEGIYFYKIKDTKDKEKRGKIIKE